MGYNKKLYIKKILELRRNTVDDDFYAKLTREIEDYEKWRRREWFQHNENPKKGNENG